MEEIKDKARLSNIELLRIIAMLMIVAHHYCIHGVFAYWHTNSTLTCYLNNVLTGIISMGGKIGVDIFVLITGYFMINSDFKFKKAAKLYLKTLIYSLLFLAVAYIYGEHHVPSKILNQSLFPFGGNAYWFITAYLMLYIFSPFLNKFILTGKKAMLNSFMTVTTCLWVLIPTFTHANYCFSDLAWFIYLYFVGASIKLKTFASIFSDKKLFRNLFIFSCTALVIYAFIRYLGEDVNLYSTIKWARMQTIFIVSISVYIFHCFKDLKIGRNKFINFISASVLGVYLFHDNNIVRPFLWRNVLHPCSVMDKHYMILYLLTAVIAVFILGIILDKIMMLIFKRPTDKVLTALSQNIDRFKKNRQLQKICGNLD